MSNFSEKIQRIEKELFKILSTSTQAIYDLVLKYNDLLPAIATEKKANDRMNIERKFKTDIENFIAEKEKLQIEMLKEVRKKTRPLTYSTYTDRQGGFIEFNNALMFVNNLPGDFENILEYAFIDGRNDFVFSVCELVNDNKKIDGEVRNKIEKLSYEFKNDLEILQIEVDSFDLSEVLKKAKDMLGLNYNESKPVWDSLHTIQLDKLSEINPALYINLKAQKYPAMKVS